MENEGGPDQDRPKLSYEELEAELSKVRREAASKRVANKEKEAELEAFRAWKESQMTELERATKRAAELEAERDAARIEAARDVAKAKFGLDDEDLEFIHGKTREEILTAAEKYASRIGKREKEDSKEEPKPSGAANLFPGVRGNPVGSSRSDINEYLRAQLRGEA